MNHLDNEEKELLTSYGLGEWKPIADLESEMERYRKYAHATLSDDGSANNHNRTEQRRPS